MMGGGGGGKLTLLEQIAMGKTLKKTKARPAVVKPQAALTLQEQLQARLQT
jgi:hypothetical protein